jgi:hypothetical protein
MTSRKTPEQVLEHLLQQDPDLHKELPLMTQRDRVEKDVQPTVGVYETNERTSGATIGASTTARPASRINDTTSDPDVTAATPGDLVRWGSVLAGLFAALATLITLSILGLAIGAAAFDPATSQAGNFGIGAGIWGAVTALLSFLVGGWIAGRSAKFAGTNSGILQGAMVWFVAIPMLVYLLSAGIGTLLSTAGSVAGTAAQVAGSAAGAAAGAAADNPAAQATAGAGVDAAQDAAGAAQATAQAAIDNVSAQDVEDAASATSRGAWGTLLSLGLAAAAAIGGSYLGSQQAEASRRTVKV